MTDTPVPDVPRKTPDEWIAERPGLCVLDPDGWRGADGRKWSDPITEAEFTRRLWMCTITWPGVTSPPYTAASHSPNPPETIMTSPDPTTPLDPEKVAGWQQRAVVDSDSMLLTEKEIALERAEDAIQRVRALAGEFNAEDCDGCNAGDIVRDILAALDSTDPKPAPKQMSDADEAALLARQRDDVLARCAAREAAGCTYIRIADLYEAFLHDPADSTDPVEDAPKRWAMPAEPEAGVEVIDEQGYRWLRSTVDGGWLSVQENDPDDIGGMSWGELLAEFGPVTVAPDDAQLPEERPEDSPLFCRACAMLESTLRSAGRS